MPETEPVVRFNSSRFGDLEVPESRIIDVPDGVIGFPDFKRYALLDASGGSSVFLWLQSIDEPNLAFIIADPKKIVPDYNVESAEPDLLRLNLDKSEEVGLFVIITVPPDNPDKTNANLLAPLIYRKSGNTIHQIVLERGNWPLRFYIFDADEGSGTSGDNPEKSGEVR